MSSPPNRAYRSRLFAWLNRQYIKLKDKSAKSWRGLKLTVTWGTQILLYPIYLLAQTTRLIGRQLQSQVKLIQAGDQSSSIPPTVATVNTLETWFPEADIQGIATDTDSHKLLLVQPDNQLLDILNEQQEKNLSKIIIQNLADYWRQQRNNTQITLAKKFPNRLASINTNNPNVILPIRLFWQIMAWIQNSPVAGEVNLFGEAYLVEPVVNKDNLNHQSSKHWDSFQAIQNLIAQAIDYFFGAHHHSTGISGTKTLRIENLLSGRDREKHYFLPQAREQYLPPAASTPVASKTTLRNKHWLTWEDLYNEEESTFLEYVPVVKKSPENEVKKEVLELEEEEAEYWETQVTDLGYLEHPIAKFLRWLDQVIVRIENLLINIWEFLFKKNK